MRWKKRLSLLLLWAQSYEHKSADMDFRAKDLAFLIPHARKFVLRYFGLFLLLLMSSGLSLPGPAITGLIIDKVFVSKDASRLNLFVGLLLAILLLSETVRMAQEYSMLRLSQELTYSIRINLIERILRLPFSFFKNFQTGYLVSRLDEVSLLGNFFSVAILSLAENLVRFVGAVFLISRYNLRMTLTSLLVLPLFFEVARRSLGAIRSTSLGTMEKSAKIRGKIQETLSGIEVVKTYAKEDNETASIKTGLRTVVEQEFAQNLFSSVSGKLLGIITAANLLAILWIGGHEIIAGRLTVGQYVAFVSYVGFLYGPIQMFAYMFLQFQRAFMACKRISAFLEKTAEDEAPDRKHVLPFVLGDIHFKGVSYDYGDGNAVLQDISFSIRKGEKIAFVGRSGSGKSTLVHLIVGLYNPVDGNIEVDGVNVRNVTLNSLRRKIGIVSQNIFLFDDSILNNIKYSRPDAPMPEVIAAAEAAGCHEFISDFPDGYATNAGEIGNRLSGGEKQRISIARCLLKKPDLVIFDEPTAHLDPLSIKAMITSFQELFRDKTCIFISHSLGPIQWVDRIFVMNQGRIVQEGTHADLLKSAGEYRNLFNESARQSA